MSIRMPRDTMPFNAQTALASSYGVLQLMYESALTLPEWRDPFGPDIADVHPHYLFDTQENFDRRDGSLRVGSVLLLHNLRGASEGYYFDFEPVQGRAPRPPIDIKKFSLTEFASFDAFQDRWTEGLILYNRGFQGYERDVMDDVDKFQPTLPSAGFQ